MVIFVYPGRYITDVRYCDSIFIMIFYDLNVYYNAAIGIALSLVGYKVKVAFGETTFIVPVISVINSHPWMRSP